MQRSEHPQDYDAQIAYFSTITHILLGRRAARSADELGGQIDQARSGIARGLEKLTLALGDASAASDRAANAADLQARRMVYATWGLVIATLVLSVVTGFLVVSTRQLGSSPPQLIVLPSK